MPQYRITITSKEREAMLDLVRKHKVPVFDHGIRFSPETGWTVGAFARTDQVNSLKKAGYAVQVYEDVAKYAKARRKEVGKGPYVRKTRR